MYGPPQRNERGGAHGEPGCLAKCPDHTKARATLSESPAMLDGPHSQRPRRAALQAVQRAPSQRKLGLGRRARKESGDSAPLPRTAVLFPGVSVPSMGIRSPVEPAGAASVRTARAGLSAFGLGAAPPPALREEQVGDDRPAPGREGGGG